MSDLKSLKRNYTFISAGKLAIVENMTFAHKTNSPRDYEYAVAGPEGHWEIAKAAYEAQKLSALGETRHELRFHVKPAAVSEISTMISVSVDATPIPTEQGYVLDFRPQCRAATPCEIGFSRLPAGSTVQLLSAGRERFDVPQVLATRSGENVRFETAELLRAGMIRVLTTDAASREATLAIWNKAQLMTRATTNFSVGANSVVRAATEVAILKGAPGTHVAFFRGSSAESAYLIGRTEQIESGYIGEYLEPHLRLERDMRSYAYSALDAIIPGKSGHSVLMMPISARNNQDSISTQEQQTPEFITTHEKITLQLPEGHSADVQLFECRYYSAGTCTSTRHIAAQVERNGQTITLKPLEAQITTLWLLRADISGGQLSSPGFWNQFTIGLSHYHIFGKHPRWAFWFWFLIIIASLGGAIVVFVWLGKRKRRRAEELRLKKLESDAIADILKRDPDFSIETFKARGRQIAEKIQHAWSAGDMRECRRFLSQGVYNRFRLQLKIMREIEKRQNAMADFRIEKFFVTERHRSGEYDALIVRLDAGARDVMVDADLIPIAALGKAQEAPFQKFTEYYTFMRRRKAVTAHKESIDACSRCGTPFAAEGEINKCKSCGTIAGSGTFDWVLAEITQASEYRHNAPRMKTGEAVSADRIEDRASFVFWRDLMARLTGNRAFILRDASESYLGKKTARENLFDIAVGAAELEVYTDAKSPIEARVRIKWSAAAESGSEPRHRQSLLTLSAKPRYREHREPNARDNTESVFRIVAGPDIDETGFAEHSCSSCGAPLPETDSTECSYCHSPIQGKNADWLLESVETTIE